MEPIERIIQLLETEPETFSASWSSNLTMDKSVRRQTRNVVVLIMIETGEIIQPFTMDSTKEQKERIKDLIKPIVERDKQSIISRL